MESGFARSEGAWAPVDSPAVGSQIRELYVHGAERILRIRMEAQNMLARNTSTTEVKPVVFGTDGEPRTDN
eukprot:5050779-Pyramimonas_sp.AAC.1